MKNVGEFLQLAVLAQILCHVNGNEEKTLKSNFRKITERKTSRDTCTLYMYGGWEAFCSNLCTETHKQIIKS